MCKKWFKVIVIDNYDSFTYNLVHYLEQADCEVAVIQYHQIKETDLTLFNLIVLSPGPGVPTDYPEEIKLINKYYNQIPIFGVCMGMQIINNALGGELENMQKVNHGIGMKTIVKGDSFLFHGINGVFYTGRYHSWRLSSIKIPKELQITSIDEEGSIMSVLHENNLLSGVQFHPESVLTPDGQKMIRNLIEYYGF